MPTPVPPDPAFADRVRASFARQQIMHLIGATLTNVEPGAVEIMLPFRADLTQQHGFIHAGVITTIVDSACGYAALTLVPPAMGALASSTRSLTRSCSACGGAPIGRWR